MSRTRPTVLVVDDDPDLLRMTALLLERAGGCHVEMAENGQRAVEVARSLGATLDVVLCDYSMPVLDGLETCIAMRAEPLLEGVIFVMFTAHAETQLKIRALDAGVDDFLAKPVGQAELLAKTRSALRTKALFDRVREEKSLAEAQHAATSHSFGQLVDLLGHVVELRTPGAADRGARLARAAKAMAERMQVPADQARALETAGRLFEVGKLIDADGPSMDKLATSPVQRRGALAAAVLERVVALRPAAQVLESVGEAWDGTGGPERLRQTVIPIGSRILRALIDFFSEQDRSNVKQAIAAVSTRAGTVYDPLVVGHLEQLARAPEARSWRAHGDRVPVRSLAEGMVLEEDLLTSSGIKLAASGTRLTRGVLDLIQRRHENEPFLHGAVVRRGTGGG
jgi:putative two-component system response regulator